MLNIYKIVTKILHAKYRLPPSSKLIQMTWFIDNFFNISSLITSNLNWNFIMSPKCITLAQRYLMIIVI